MSGIGYQMFGFAASIVSVVFLAPIVSNWVKEAMPSAKMNALDALLCQMEALLRSALEEGTIDYAYYDRNFRDRIWAAKRCADDHRAEIYNISGWWHELRLWAKGRARSISAAIDNVHEVRVLIATSSARGRQQLTRQGWTANPAYLVYSERDHVSKPTPPAIPANTATSFGTETWPKDTQRNLLVECNPNFAPIEGDERTLISGVRHLIDLNVQALHGRGQDEKVDALPTLAFPCRLKTATSHGRRSMRVVQHGLVKQPNVDGALDQPAQSCGGFLRPLRIFYGLFRRSPTNAESGNGTAFSLSIPPPRYTSLDAAIDIHQALGAENGYSVQVKLEPV